MRRLLRLWVAAFVLTAAGLPVALEVSPAAAADAAKASSNWLQIPKPAKGKGDKCVADTEYMRRNHMNLLLHQRDDTVHDGIRTKRFSLNECITCHAVTEKGAARPVTVKSPKHFCRSCHDYVAVRVDCFQCHASRPDAGAAAAAKPGKGVLLTPSGFPGQSKEHGQARRADAAALARYVRSARQ